jgi:hypothetical protein
VITAAALDRVLAIQFTVAWAGEREHLGWWDMEMSDPEGGGCFLKRMFPRTGRWLALQCPREAARQIDARTRRRMAEPDAVVTLFHLGATWDVALAERLVDHKYAEAGPAVLGPALGVRETFDRASFEQYLADLASNVTYAIAPWGRHVGGPAGPPEEAVPRLAAALLPLGSSYPLPYVVRTWGGASTVAQTRPSPRRSRRGAA